VKLRDLVKSLTPPLAVELAGRIRSTGNQWTGDYETWAAALVDSTGYDDPAIVERARVATLAVKQGHAAYERDTVTFDRIEYSWALLSGLMWIAARLGRLHVIDFGGALGSSYFQNRAFLRDLPDVRWTVVEQPQFVEIGTREIADETLRFARSVDECEGDVIVFSSVLEYLDDPHALVRRLDPKIRFAIVDLTPMHDGARDRLTLQRVPAHIYRASYPCWMLSREKLRASFDAFDIVAEFEAHIGRDVHVGDLQAGYRGFIAERRHR
jgi:putative methyltransferase (TIGR04325 family)